MKLRVFTYMSEHETLGFESLSVSLFTCTCALQGLFSVPGFLPNKTPNYKRDTVLTLGDEYGCFEEGADTAVTREPADQPRSWGSSRPLHLGNLSSSKVELI